MLAPNHDLIKELLIKLYKSQQSVTFAALALQHTRLFPPQDPTPSWFSTLNHSLEGIQPIAGDWLVTKGPQVIATLPQQFISYSSHFRAFAENARTADLSRLQHDVRWLQSHVRRMPDQATQQQQSVSTFASDFSSQKQGLDIGIAGAEQALQSERQQVRELKAQISSLYQKISTQTADANNEMTGVVTSGGAMAFALLSYGFDVAVLAGASAFPFVGVGVALAGLTFDAVMHAIHEREVVDDLRRIGVLKVELTQDAQEIAALQGITSSLESTDSALLEIRTSLGFRPIWEEVESQLETLAQQLQQPGVDYRNLEQISTLPSAVAAWEAIATMCTNVQTAAAGLTHSWTVDLNHLT